jgi:hypothetical protein
MKCTGCIQWKPDRKVLSPVHDYGIANDSRDYRTSNDSHYTGTKEKFQNPELLR